MEKSHPEDDIAGAKNKSIVNRCAVRSINRMHRDVDEAQFRETGNKYEKTVS